MFPLILLVLGLTAVLSAYEFSPRVRSRIDDYAWALRAAHEAHRTADEHLAKAHQAAVPAVQPPRRQRLRRDGAVSVSHPVELGPTVPAAPTPFVPQVPPSRAIDHVITASVANQQAAQSTAEAGRIAQTSAERGAVVDSAVRVLEREKRIAEALANLGVGQCGLRSYSHVTPQMRDAILDKLHAEGMTVTGEDPWDIDTQVAGVKLRAVWDPGTEVLRLIVTGSSFLAPCDMIWGRIETALRGVIGS